MDYLRDAPVSAVLTDDPRDLSVPSALDVSRLSSGSFKRGLRSGMLGSEAASYMTRAMEARAAGDLNGAAYWENQSNLVSQNAAQMAPDVTSVADVKGLGDAVTYGLGMAGQGIGSTLEPAAMATGAGMLATGAMLLHPATRPLARAVGLRNPATWAAAAGASVPGYQMERDEAVMNAAQDPTVMATRTPQEILEAARFKGAVNMIPETVLPTMVAGRLGRSVMRPFAKQTPGRLAGEFATGMGVEGTTELVQGEVGRGVQSHLNPARDTSEDMISRADDFLGGALGGGGMQVPTTMIDAAKLAIPARTAKDDTGSSSEPEKSPGERLRAFLTRESPDEVGERLTTDKVDPGIVARGGEAVQEALASIDVERATEVANRLGEKLADSKFVGAARDKATSLYEALQDPERRSSALSEARTFVMEDLKGTQAKDKVQKLYKTAGEVVSGFREGWKAAGKKRSEELDATDRAVQDHFKAAFEAKGMAGEAPALATSLRLVAKNPIRDEKMADRFMTGLVENLGEDTLPALTQAYTVLERDGADPKVLQNLGHLMKSVDTFTKDLESGPGELATKLEALVPSAQREAIAKAMDRRDVSGKVLGASPGDFLKMARALRAKAEGEQVDDKAIEFFFGPNTSKAVALAEAAVAARRSSLSKTETMQTAAPESAVEDEANAADVEVDEEDSPAFKEQKAKMAENISTKDVYSFRDGKYRKDHELYDGKLYDTVEDADMIKKRLDPDGIFASMYRTQAMRVPVVVPAVDFAKAKGLDIKILASKYGPAATDDEARATLKNKAVIEAKPLTANDPTEFDRTAVAIVTSGENRVVRATNEYDTSEARQKTKRYFVNKETGTTSITNPGPSEGALFVRAAKNDGTPDGNAGGPKYLRIDLAALAKEMLRRGNAMRSQMPGEELGTEQTAAMSKREKTLGMKQLQAVMDGLVSMLTTPGNGIYAPEGVFAYRNGELKEVLMAGREEGRSTNVRSLPLLPYDMKIGRHTVGDILGMTEAQYKAKANLLLQPQILKAKGDAFRKKARTSPEYKENLAHQRLEEETRRREEGPRFDDKDIDTEYLFSENLEGTRRKAETTTVAKEVITRTRSEPQRRERVKLSEKEKALPYVKPDKGGDPTSGGVYEKLFERSQGMVPASILDKRANLANVMKRIRRFTDTIERHTDLMVERAVPPTPAMKAKLANLQQTLRKEELSAERISASIDAELQKHKTAEAKPGSPETQKAAPIKQMTDEERTAERKKFDARKLSAQADKSAEQPKRASLKDRKAAEEYVERTLGKKIKLVFEKALGGHSGEWSPGDTVNTIKISLGAGPGVLSTAFHESLHEFFNRLGKTGNTETQALLKRVGGNPMIRKQLARLFADDAGVLAAIEADAEERVAYAYQLWAAAKHGGPKFTVGPETETFFQKMTAFFRRVFGLVTEDEQAEQIFEAFYAGEMKSKTSMNSVLKGMKDEQKTVESVKDFLGKPLKAAMRHIMPGHDALMESGIPSLVEIAKQFHNPPDGEAEAQGYLNARPQQTAIWLNRMSGIAEGLDQETRNLAAAHLMGLKKGRPAYKPAADLVDATYALLSRGDKSFLKYLQDAKVPVKELHDFFPRVWNMDVIEAERKEFAGALLKKNEKYLADIGENAYKKAMARWEKFGKKAEQPTPDRQLYTAEFVAAQISITLAAQNGVVDDTIEADVESGKAGLAEREDRLGFTPFMAAINERSLKDLNMEGLDKYVHKDYTAIMGAYLEQGVRRAEYARRFGNDGSLLRQRLQTATDEVYTKLRAGRKDKDIPPKEKDKLHKQADAEVAKYTREIMAMEGTLGHDISPEMRKWMGYMIVYQNVRILPLSLFSSFIDAQGVLIRGGTMRESFNTFTRGMREIYSQFQSEEKQLENKKKDYWVRFAETMGTVDNAILQDAIQQAYTGMYMYGRAKRINDKVFKYNGMEAWNRGMRIGATQAAVGFFKRQLSHPGEHSDRWLKELGVRREDLQLNEQGQLKFTVEEGLTTDQANRMRAGLQKWVDSAILRPNSAQRPAWASDPHYGLIFHLKQYTYSFHTTIIRQVIKEAQHGNMAPAVGLLSYLPVMIAADILRGMVQSGGGEPEWKKGWGPAEYVSYGAQRAGFFGLGQFGIDAFNMGPQSLAGPTADQISGAIMDPLDKTAANALPQVARQMAVTMQQD